MAISFIGSAVGSSSPNTATTITLPTLNADDLIIIAAAVGDTANNGIPAPTGYSRVPGVAATLYANDTNDTNLDLYYKKAVAGDSGATVTLTATGGTNASNAGVAMVFRGVDTTTPFDVNATTATGIDTSNADPPSIDFLDAAAWTVIAASTGHTGGATATFTFPANYTTNAAQRAHNDTIDVLVGMGYRTNPADPENPGALTAANIGTASANAWCAATLALRVAPVVVQVEAFAEFLGVGTLTPVWTGLQLAESTLEGVGTLTPQWIGLQLAESTLEGVATIIADATAPVIEVEAFAEFEGVATLTPQWVALQLAESTVEGVATILSDATVDEGDAGPGPRTISGGMVGIPRNPPWDWYRKPKKEEDDEEEELLAVGVQKSGIDPLLLAILAIDDD